MYIDLSQLLTSEYFLDTNPGGDFLFGYPLLVVFIFSLFSKSLVVRFGPKNKYFRKSIRKSFGKFVALGVIGVVLTAARFSTVPFFSMRLWLYIIFLLTLLFAVLTFLKVKNEYRNRLESVQREKQKRGEYMQ